MQGLPVHAQKKMCCHLLPSATLKQNNLVLPKRIPDHLIPFHLPLSALAPARFSDLSSTTTSFVGPGKSPLNKSHPLGVVDDGPTALHFGRERR